MPDLLAELRAAFPVRERWLYFNHAAVSPLSVPVAEAMQAFQRDALENGSVRFQAWLDRRESARRQGARLLGADPSEVAFTTSTSQGLLTVAEGLRMEAGDEILVIQDDFPANQIPWFRQERRGARVVVVPRHEGRVRLQDILDRVGPRTRVVAVPWVFYDSGQRLDLVALGAELADQRALFCVDAIQGLGGFPLDVEAARIDFLSADSHKWMLGLEGVGLFYCRREHLDALDDPFQSWLSVVDPFGPYDPGKARVPDARRFEFASLPTVALFGMQACLELLLRTGAPLMAERILEVTDHLAAGLERCGWRVTSPREHADEKSGIVQGIQPSGSLDETVAALEARGVSVAQRGGGVRFSPHAWNTVAEVDQLLERLDGLVA